MKYIFEIDESPENFQYPIQIQKSINGALGQKKYISITEFQNVFAAAILTDSAIADLGYSDAAMELETGTPILPFGTIHYANTEHFERITVCVPKGLQPIRYSSASNKHQEETSIIGLPKLIFQFKLTKHPSSTARRIVNSKCFAIKNNQKLNGETELMTFPFPNVSKGKGYICWGNITPQELTFEDLSFIDNAIAMFLGAVFNEDYGLGIVGYQSFYDYLKKNEGKPFDDNLLLSASNMLVKDLFGTKIINGK